MSLLSTHSIRAIAVASDTSDLVGTVELSCGADGLALSFIRASAYAAAYVPTASASGRRAIVPYECIKEAWDDGDTLRLVLEAPRIPYRRLMLAHFTRDGRVDHRVLHRRRLLTQLAVAGGASIAAAAALAIAASIGALAGVIFGGMTTFGAVAGGIVLAQGMGRSAMLGGEGADAERRVFFATLRQHLPAALVFDDGPIPSPPSTVAATPAAVREAASGLFGEVTPTLLAAGASALVALIALFAGARLLAPREDAPARADTTEARAAGAVSAPAPVVAHVAPPLDESLDSCLCQIPASPAVPVRVPRVTVLDSVLRARTDPKHPSISLEIAAVNNGNTPLREVEGVVDFTTTGRKEGDPDRVRAEKGMYYEGPLAPGAAIKWHIGGRGTGYRVTLKGDESLDDGSIAPSDAFAKLLSAHTRSVRIHGAAMLARARDERALPAIEKLREDARESEIELLAALARAAAPIYTCELEVTSEGNGTAASACVMNTSDEVAGPFDAMLTLSRSGKDASAGERGPVASAAVARRVRIPARAGVRIHGVAEAVRTEKDLLGEIVLEPSTSR